MAKSITNKKVIRSDTDTTPDNAEWRGEHIVWGGQNKKVFVEKVEVAEIVPLMDPHTNGPLYKRGSSGQTLGTVHTRRVVTGHIEREFIVDDLGNGQVEKVYDFRPNPEDALREEKLAKRQRILDDILDRAVEAGGLDALLGEGEDFPKHIGGPKWELSNGESFKGSRDAAEKAEAALTEQAA